MAEHDNVAVTTNGVTELRPRELPFPRDGYGQDDEWVMANFTNSTEILAVGYPQWVDAQVGEGLTNGLYKLTVTVPYDPPETTLLTVGDISVAVTNAGAYVFLLGKGVDYPLSAFPDTATNFAYAAVDDIPSGLDFMAPPDSLSGEWTVDRGRLEIVPPAYPMTLYTPRSHAVWTPCLSVSPSTWQPSALNGTETFTAVLSDIPPFAAVSYRWNTSDPGVVSVRGVSEGVATLTVKVGDCRSDAPTFDVNVVQNVTVNLRAWIITDVSNNKAMEPEDVRRMMKDANDIYTQVGVTLNLIEPIVVTNIPNAFDALLEPPTNETSTWSFQQIVEIASNTGGLECYFIGSFADESHVKAAHNGYGIVITSLATRYTLAHEIGHAFGMHDIYITNGSVMDDGDSLVSLDDNEWASWTYMSGDWSGGCHGSGRGGSRYYRFGMSMKEVVGRMTMNGLVGEVDERRDITNGDVHGVHYEESGGAKAWYKNDAPTAFPWFHRNPTHL